MIATEYRPIDQYFWTGGTGLFLAFD